VGRVLLEKRKMKQISVEVQNVKVIRAAPDLVQHRKMGGKIRFQRASIKTDRLVADRDEARLGAGVGAGKEGDVVAEIDKRVAEISSMRSVPP
jgi:hypothetical protein